jgi:hypothetical protein
MIRAWARRTVELQRELAAIVQLDLRWRLLAAGVAFAEVHAPPEIYLASDAEADADTFMGYRATRPRDLVSNAIHRARAARIALRELDGTLPDQPLAVTIDRSRGGQTITSDLEVAAFAIGAVCLIAKLDDPALAAQLAAVLEGADPPAWTGAAPFVCVSIGDEPIATARHGHRRAWTERGGPWLGLGRAGDIAIVSTCHLVIDGYGHACLAARIAELVAASSSPAGTARIAELAAVSSLPQGTARVAELVAASNSRAGTARIAELSTSPPSAAPSFVAGRAPSLSAVHGAVPLAIAWRELSAPTPRLIPLAYQLGCILHQHAGDHAARFSPAIQIPVARGDKDDPDRLRRRIVSASVCVQFTRSGPEPYAAFEARIREVFSREAAGRGLVSRLLAVARAVPLPLAWKRKSISAKRSRWLERFAEVIGGRALLSRIALDTPVPPLYAVSSPSRLATENDPVGGCVITIVDDGSHGAITVCGSGFAGTPQAASALLDRLLASVESDRSRAAAL